MCLCLFFQLIFILSFSHLLLNVYNLEEKNREYIEIKLYFNYI